MTKPVDYYSSASHPESSFLIGQDRVKRVIALARSFKAQRFLDIGCGDGTITQLAAKSLGASEVYGVDIAPQAVESARQKGVQASVANLDEAGLPFRDGSFDAILCAEVLEHLFDPDHLLDEIHRLLRPSGFGIISTPNLAAWTERLGLLLGYQPHCTSPSLRFASAGKLFMSDPAGGGEHLHVMTYKAFKTILLRHGFRVVRIVGAWGQDSPSILPLPIRLIYSVVSRLARSRPSLAPFSIAVVTKVAT